MYHLCCLGCFNWYRIISSFKPLKKSLCCCFILSNLGSLQGRAWSAPVCEKNLWVPDVGGKVLCKSRPCTIYCCGHCWPVVNWPKQGCNIGPTALTHTLHSRRQDVWSVLPKDIKTFCTSGGGEWDSQPDPLYEATHSSVAIFVWGGPCCEKFENHCCRFV